MTAITIISVATPSMMPRKENPAMTEIKPSFRRARKYRPDSSHSNGAKGGVRIGSLMRFIHSPISIRFGLIVAVPTDIELSRSG